MHSVSVFVVLVCVVALAYGQDSLDHRICSFVTTGDGRIPVFGEEDSVYTAGYEKKSKSSAMDHYALIESGVYAYASKFGTSTEKESAKMLRSNVPYKHIWDYEANQVLALNLADAWQPDSCAVLTFDQYSNAEQSITGIIGLSKARKRIFGPLGVFFLDIPATKTEEHEYNDMIVDIYTSCYYDKASQLTVSVIWRYLQTPVVPQSAVFVYSKAGGVVQQIALDFFNVLLTPSVPGIGLYPFELPNFYICKDWAHQKPPMNLTSAFSFDSEVLLKNDDPNQPHLILSYSDHLDAMFNVSKRTTVSGQMDGSTTTTSVVFDGASGIRYTIDDNLGNCSMSIANLDNTDILWAHLLNPSDFWKNGGQQYYGGLKTWRAMVCHTIVYEVLDPVYRVNVRYEMYIALSTNFLHLPMKQMPVAQLVGVPQSFQPRITTYQNVFNFDLSSANVANYDISACYVLETQRHFIMTFPANSDVSQKISDALKDQFIRTAARVSKLSPVRITMVEIESTDNMYITFTVLHKNQIPGAMQVQATSAGVSNLLTAVSDRNFKINLRYTVDKETELVATDLVEIPRRTPQNWFRGFGGGDLAAVSLAMFFGTMIVAILVFYFVITPFYIPTLSGGGGTEVNIS